MLVEAATLCGSHSTSGSCASRRKWCRCARVCLRCQNRGFLALRFRQDLLDVLVSSLGWLPIGVAAGLSQVSNVHLIKEDLVRVVVRLWCGGRHIALETQIEVLMRSRSPFHMLLLYWAKATRAGGMLAMSTSSSFVCSTLLYPVDPPITVRHTPRFRDAFWSPC